MDHAADRLDILRDVLTAEATARAALAVLAIVLIAWFTVLVGRDRLAQDARARLIAEPRMSDREWDRTMGDFEDAAALKPGTEWDNIRANYLLVRDKPAAVRLAASVVRREPDNLDSWAVILRGAGESDPRRSEAARQVRRLVGDD